MARYLFGDGAMDLVVGPPSSSPSMATTDGATVLGVVIAQPFTQVLVSLTKGGTVETDLTDADGNPLTEVLADANGRYRFRGPDEVKVLWLSGDGGETWTQALSSEILAKINAYRDPFVTIDAGETGPPDPVGTPSGTVILRRLA